VVGEELWRVPSVGLMMPVCLSRWDEEGDSVPCENSCLLYFFVCVLVSYGQFMGWAEVSRTYTGVVLNL
jgi:hypothetical protein